MTTAARAAGCPAAPGAITRSYGSLVTGTKSRPNALAAAMMPSPASARPAAIAAATARWVGSSRGVALDGARVYPELPELVVEQNAGAGATLPVDVPQARPGQVMDPADAKRVARRDKQPLVAVDQPDDGHLRGGGAEHLVHVGHGVLPARRVEQVRSGDVAEPVAQRHEAAEGADVGRRQRHHRIVSPQGGRGKVKHQVVRADRDDRAGDLVEAAQQFHRDRRARVVSFYPGRHDEQPVGSD